MSEDELKQAARFEAERYIPYGVREVNMDFDVIGETTEDNQRKIVVLLVAARRDIVDKHVQALESGGVEPFVLDVESFAVIRALVAQGRTDTNGGATGFVDPGGGTADILITRGAPPPPTPNTKVGAVSPPRIAASPPRLEDFPRLPSPLE